MVESANQQIYASVPITHTAPRGGYQISILDKTCLRSAMWRGVAMVETARATVERRTAKNCIVQGSIEVKGDEWLGIVRERVNGL